MLAFALDPRFKHLPDLDDNDISKLKTELKRRLMKIAEEPNYHVVMIDHHEHNERMAFPPDVYGDLFEDIEAPHAVTQNNAATNIAHNDNIVQIVEAQLTIFWATEGMKRLTSVGTNLVINNPLDWWRLHQHKFPLVAALARRLLSIPATSAPSERLFSDAGITIANDRASLLPDVAASCIFLQDAWEWADAYLHTKMNRV